jgi:hypothetical protein
MSTSARARPGQRESCARLAARGWDAHAAPCRTGRLTGTDLHCRSCAARGLWTGNRAPCRCRRISPRPSSRSTARWSGNTTSASSSKRNSSRLRRRRRHRRRHCRPSAAQDRQQQTPPPRRPRRPQLRQLHRRGSKAQRTRSMRLSSSAGKRPSGGCWHPQTLPCPPDAPA